MAGRVFPPVIVAADEVREGDKLLLAWGASEASFWLVEEIEATGESSIVFHVRKMDFGWTNTVGFDAAQQAVVVRAV